MIKNKTPNPLNVFQARQVKSAPPHFEYVNLPMKYNLEDSLIKWVKQHLKHRFYIGKNVNLDSDSKLTQVLTVGFEETKDMSYFMLACPHLKYK
jgi:hypothetical protein|tara:strand:- start:5681 stop:5962 length:282 start_codon:yes stop_codon:yes gene_type:complete